jgi:type VI protein secretion system component VasF
MTPKFAQYVDPIIEHVIDFLLAVENREPRSGQGEWNSLNTKLQRAERELSPSYGKAWELAKYALVSWTDESVRYTVDWSGREWWLNNQLEFHHFQTGEANEMFFVKAKQAEGLTNGEDAFETYYVCGMLGFRGFYGRGDSDDPQRVQLVVGRYGLANSFPEWSRETGRVIREKRKLGEAAASAEQRERRIITAKPMWSPLAVLWPWLLVLGLASANVVAWYYRK